MKLVIKIHLSEILGDQDELQNHTRLFKFSACSGRASPGEIERYHKSFCIWIGSGE